MCLKQKDACAAADDINRHYAIDRL